MAKKSISVTLEETTSDNLRTIADEEMRSVSNLIDYIVAQYAKNMRNYTAYDKINRAAAFGKNVDIGVFSQTNDTLMGNVSITEEDACL